MPSCIQSERKLIEVKTAKYRNKQGFSPMSSYIIIAT